MELKKPSNAGSKHNHPVDVLEDKPVPGKAHQLPSTAAVTPAGTYSSQTVQVPVRSHTARSQESYAKRGDRCAGKATVLQNILIRAPELLLRKHRAYAYAVTSETGFQAPQSSWLNTEHCKLVQTLGRVK